MSRGESEHPGKTSDGNEQNAELEQWKFYGQSTHQVSNRRLKNNRFYLRLLIALLGVTGIGVKLGYVTPVGIMFIGAIGLPFCVLWTFHILSYKQLNSGKYRVLWEMAENLPYDPFKMEWDRLDEGDNPDVYIKHTTVEVWWPRVFGFFYAVLFIYGTLSLLSLLSYYWWAVGILAGIWAIYAFFVLRGKSPTQKYWDYTGNE
ncbi:hypothetical protein GJR96_07810 [Haloferax sp. MBLA0076]|uniref:Uncharacterized protein n=1 Tax=Haloferax litoreum TaxID=2666140 RepID=A0A6A8GJH1_9EURY|nr:MULTISPECIES: hypothetical protein [Haloferax]KAB1193352.1 hypothetical protein Hfx1148_07800 [Haloferax sp. CBA1148]MRX21860.1 hypothetical protein [Haloferax litoreum]